MFFFIYFFKLVRIIKHIRDSMTGQMFCFSPEDTLFVLNKWDSIEDDEENEEFFELTKTKLQTIWREVDDRHILKLSAIKVCTCNFYEDIVIIIKYFIWYHINTFHLSVFWIKCFSKMTMHFKFNEFYFCFNVQLP